MYDVRLEVNGVQYGGFRSGEFTLSLEQMCNDFSLKCTNTWVNEDGSASADHPPIEEGNRCKFIVDDSTMIDGWVDNSDASYDPTSYHLEVNGRSTSCDLVDCSAVPARGGQWVGQTVHTIVSDLVQPFAAVRFAVENAGAAIPKFTLQRGETVGAAILRAAHLRHLLVYTAGDTLMIAKAGSTRTSTVLRRGERIIEAKKHSSLAERYSDYTFKGQTLARDEVNGVAASQIHNAVHDNGVPRYRPLMIVSNGHDGPSDLGARAIMERNQRAGRAERLTVKVEGWKTDEGYLWEPNIRVQVTDDWHDIDQDMIVVSATFSFSGDTGAGGYATSLELCDPRAFEDGDVPLVRRRRRRPATVTNPLLATTPMTDGIAGQPYFVSFGTGSGFAEGRPPTNPNERDDAAINDALNWTPPSRETTATPQPSASRTTRPRRHRQ